MKAAIVGTSPVTAALTKLLGSDVTLAAHRTTADHIAQAVGADGFAVLDLPAGESREFVRSIGARGVRVVDLGPDLRIPSIPCGFPEAFASGKRLVALPSPAAMAAWCAAGPLLDAGLLHGDRLSVTAIGGGGGAAALTEAASGVAAELGWILEQRGAPQQRRVSSTVRGGEGLLVLVQGEVGREEALDANAVRDAMSHGPEWLRPCPEHAHPDAARVAGSGAAEVSAAVDGFAEWMLCACAVDPVWFTAHAAARAVQAMRG